MKEQDTLLNLREASCLLGITAKTLYQWRWRRQHLPFIKVGRALRISERDLNKFIEKMKEPPLNEKKENGAPAAEK